MKILIIEDDKNKMRRLENEIKEIYKDVEIYEARSYQSGLSHLMSNKEYDCVLLDMSLPIFDITQEEDGFQFDPFAGRNILAEMDRKSIDIPTAVITMFETFGEGTDLMTLDELNKELKSKYPNIYKGSIYYNSSEINWKDSLHNFLKDFL